MKARRPGRLAVRPFVFFAVLLAQATLAGRLVGGLASVLVTATVAVIGVVVAVVARTNGRDRAYNSWLATAAAAAADVRDAA